MLRAEWRKMLLHRRGLWLLLAVLALILTQAVSVKPYDAVLEENRAVYDEYLQKVRGPLTPEKREFMESEMERLGDNHRALEKLKSDYYAGKVTEEAYREAFPPLASVEARYMGFAKLYTQYIFVRERPGLRTFLYTGGWEALLGDENPPYLLLLLLVALVVPIFCEEYENRMSELLMTQKKGAARLVWVKVLTAVLTASLLMAASEVFRVVVCAIRFGLPDGGASLQSLTSFGYAEKPLKLWQAFLVQFALKELGAVTAAGLLLAISVLLRKFAWTLAVGLAALPLPFLTVGEVEPFLHFPGPWGPLMGCVYLRGPVRWLDQSGEVVVASPEPWLREIGLALAGCGVLLAVSVLIVWLRNCNRHLLRRKRAVSAVALALILPLLAGCGAREASQVFNSAEAGWCDTGEYVIVSPTLGVYLRVDEDAGTISPFPLEALPTGVCGGFYQEGDRVYTIAVADSYRVEELRPATMDARTRFEVRVRTKWFFGLLSKEPEETLFTVESFFIRGNWMYFRDYQGELRRRSLITGKDEPVLEGLSVANVAYDGRSVWYLDEYSRLCRRDLDTGTVEASEKVTAQDFRLTAEGAWFLSRRDNGALCWWDRASDTVTRVCDIPGTSLLWDGEYVWLTGRDYRLYRVDRAGNAADTGLEDAILRGAGRRYVYFQLFGDMSGELDALDRESLAVSVVYAGEADGESSCKNLKWTTPPNHAILASYFRAEHFQGGAFQVGGDSVKGRIAPSRLRSTARNTKYGHKKTAEPFAKRALRSFFVRKRKGERI